MQQADAEVAQVELHEPDGECLKPWLSKAGPLAPPLQDSNQTSSLGRTTFSRACQRVSVEQSGMSVFDVGKVYANASLFKRCSMEFVRSLINEGGPQALTGKIYDPNVMIVEQGSFGNSMYIIHRGDAEVIVNGDRVNKMGAGDCFGEMQMLGLVANRTATIRSLTICHLFEVTCEVFVKLLMRFRTERRLFEKEAMTRYRDINVVACKQKQRKSKVHPAVDRASFRASVIELETKEEMHASRHGRLRAQQGCHPGTLAGLSSPDDELHATSTTTTSTALPLSTMLSGASPIGGGSTMSRAHGNGDGMKEQSRCTRLVSSDSDVELNEGSQPKKKDEEESFVQRVTRSLRTDMKRGFLMPAGERGRVTGKVGAVLPSVVDSEDFEDTADFLDPRLLPPTGYLSPVQKQGLLRQLRMQARYKVRRGVSKITSSRVLSKLKNAGLAHAREQQPVLTGIGSA